MWISLTPGWSRPRPIVSRFLTSLPRLCHQVLAEVRYARVDMIVAGCDIGSTWGKALIMNNGNIASYTIRPVHHIPVKTAHEVIEEAIRQAGLSSLEDIDYIVGTGYGRLMMIPF